MIDELKLLKANMLMPFLLVSFLAGLGHAWSLSQQQVEPKGPMGPSSGSQKLPKGAHSRILHRTIEREREREREKKTDIQ